ncbi:hypothetical protein [Terrisporobacter glycolicus]|uniref:hypothetical protein n=1 Tax=Terrisporobacter glycolicus TaxID=36841 RepID=UPI003464E346
MEVNINKVIEIYSQKLANSERENVLLQAQAFKYEEVMRDKDNKIEELEKQLKDKYKVNEDKN